MAYKLQFLAFWLAVFISVTLSSKLVEQSCPKIAMIEMYGDSKISCATNHTKITDAYWYRGSISHTSPILQLKDGKRSGTEYGKGHYEIADNGAMIIRNVSREDEAVYIFAVFFEDTTFETKNVSIFVTITPHPPCPHIDGCFSCGECKLKPNDNRTLTCNLMDFRPKMNIKWIIENAERSNFTLYPPTFMNNSVTDTWSVSIELSYKTLSCSENVVIHCVAQDDYGLLAYSSSSVQLQSDMCLDDHQGNVKHFAIVITLVGVLAILIPLVVSAWCCYKNRYRGPQTQEKNVVKCEQQFQTLDELTDEIQKAKRLINYLKDAYQPNCILQPLPWVDAIPVKLAYAHCQVTVTRKEGSAILSSVSLFTDDRLRQEQRVAIVGNIGCGKTSLTKALVQNWIENEENDSILIYVDGNEITKDLNIVDLLSTILETMGDFSITDLHSLLKISKLWLLIDDIDNLPLDADEEAGKANTSIEHDNNRRRNSNNESECQVNYTENNVKWPTVKDLLKGHRNGFGNRVQVWITSRGTKDTTTRFPLPYIEVKIDKICDKHLKSYIKGTCDYYFNVISQRDCLPKLKNSLIDQNVENEVTDSLLRETDRNIRTTGVKKILELHDTKTSGVFYTVMDFVEKNNIFQHFSNTSYLFILMVHILVAKNTNGIDFPFESIKHMGTFISAVISSMEKKFLENKTYCSLEINMNCLESTLEEFAFQLTVDDFRLVVDDDSFLMDLENTMTSAVAIGLLNEQKSEDASKNVEFCHKCIEEYFAARYIVSRMKDAKFYSQTIKTIKENEQFGVLHFITLLKTS